ncbi:MAG: UDP-N-acetylglucosamine 2-epimerase (non-hydrolyzing) [Solirubrobacterales bacterium]|nr:UDP-N-acetylglucosamine 2-epimerase (non-hydrolyzing) [Solirubrobacterales bacterium]MBV9472405.1 UDP-N-acetylglucosamine 2-epimerase (non-hydrolyzing) [Solirubrobacterales bacterium]
MTSTVVYVVGARPNFVKTAPVVRQMRTRAPWLNHVVVHTGQHYDREMSEIFFEDLDLPRPDHLLGVGSGLHGAQTASALQRIEEVLIELRPRIVVVPGDVNSTLAAALAAVKLEIEVAHLEAGLRSFDRRMPEEINRLLVDQLSRWCFIHSPEARTNLNREGIADERVFFVGNTMIDTLIDVRPRIAESDVHARLGVDKQRYLLVTLHRPALVDGPLFETVMDELVALSDQLPVVFPMHPRTRARVRGRVAGAPGLRIVDPVGYVDFLALEADAAGVLTDSGGVQEETTFLGVPCFTLRENTERPVTISQGTNRLLGLRPESVAEIPARLAGGPGEPPPRPAGWDGGAAGRVAEVLIEEISGIAANGSQDGELPQAGRSPAGERPFALQPS